MLDAVVPLVYIVEEAQQGELIREQVADAAKSALTLLGNASAQIARER